ncbi:LOB domain-containing protein 27-like [Durio zibethinus]|uniref:LOB domain-containing protein 27-like n=1 Tax=Durio zibethinus TaxID=66656 RepID=A0A6P5Y7H1_DURZI|nr:LOB domain-containing protein 27-like [Durio zibethinus]
MTLKGGTTSACAACKYQRRKCIPECLLAPYFPSDQTKVFQNAHKLFGVSNIVKILRSLDPAQHAEAMRSIKYQANVRDRFPVHGCLGVIRQLYYQIQLLEEEFYAVLAQLEMYRQHHHQQHQISSMPDDVPSQLELGMAPPTNALPLFNQVPHQPYTTVSNVQVSMQHSYSTSNNIGYSSSYVDSKENVGNNSLWIQHPFLATNNNSSNSNGSPMAIQSQLLVPNSQPLAVQQEVVQDYDEIHPFFDTIDDRQSYIDSKEAYDSSSEESPKDTTQLMEHVAENELKSAAACFSLTSVN